MRVSVCMATYNGAKYLREQIDSILSQLTAEDELVVSDDGSTDATCAIVRSYKDDRIRWLTNPGPRGPVGNFSNAMAHARGEFIALSDQDDVWVENRLERMVAVLQQLAPRSLLIGDLQQFGQIHRDDLARTIGPTPRSSITQLYRIFRGSAKYWGSCYLFRRDLLARVLPIPRYIEAHDHWIAMKAILHGKAVHFEEPTVLHRVHGENVSAVTSRKLSVIARARMGYVLGLLLTGFRSE